jgi:hypothetical protein
VPRVLRVFDGVELRECVVLRRRWLLAGTTTTRLSRCPDERPGRQVSALLIALKVWAWLAGDCGVTRVVEVHPALVDAPAPRTVQRWLVWLRPRAAWFEQALRDVILEVGSEPWPAEKLFPGGLPPPEGLRHRHSRDPEEVYRPNRGPLWLIGGSVRLVQVIPSLLARARGRWPDDAKHSLI